MPMDLPKLATVLAVSHLALAASTAAVADSVEKQIQQGLELYRTGELGAAITELEFAIADIRKAMSGRLADTFPAPLPGWSAADAESSSQAASAAAMFGGAMGSSLERRYSEDDGDGTLTATLIIDNPMIQGMAGLLNNPMLMAAQPNTERLRIGRETGMLEWQPDQASAEATLLLDGRIMMQVKGERLASPDVAAELLQSWDLEAVRAGAAR